MDIETIPLDTLKTYFFEIMDDLVEQDKDPQPEEQEDESEVAA